MVIEVLLCTVVMKLPRGGARSVGMMVHPVVTSRMMIDVAAEMVRVVTVKIAVRVMEWIVHVLPLCSSGNRQRVRRGLAPKCSHLPWETMTYAP